MRLPSPAVIQAHVLSSAAVALGVERVAQAVEVEAHVLAAERAWDSGDYSTSIRRQPETSESGYGVLVSATDPKANWLERGTGIYGPRGVPIRPKRGEFLVFPVHVSRTNDPRRTWARGLKEGDVVRMREVRGRPPSWIMRDASAAVAARFGLRWRALRAAGAISVE